MKLTATACILVFACIGESVVGQTYDKLFRADVTPDKGPQPWITIRLFYLGEGNKTVFWPLNTDIKIVSPGTWMLRPPLPLDRVVVTGTGSFGTQPITKDDPIVGFMNLKDYFSSVRPGKNTISFDFPVKLPDEKTIVTLRKELEITLTDEQIAHFSESKAH